GRGPWQWSTTRGCREPTPRSRIAPATARAYRRPCPSSPPHHPPRSASPRRSRGGSDPRTAHYPGGGGAVPGGLAIWEGPHGERGGRAVGGWRRLVTVPGGCVGPGPPGRTAAESRT